MFLLIIYTFTCYCALLGVGGDWYMSKTDFIKINSCYVFPAGTFNLWDSFCGLSTDEFLRFRSNLIQENVFVHTVNEMRLFTAITYGLTIFAVFCQFFIPNYSKLHILVLNACCASAITAVYYFLYGINLIENKGLKDNLYNIQYGFVAECAVIIITFIIFFYKIKIFVN